MLALAVGLPTSLGLGVLIGANAFKSTPAVAAPMASAAKSAAAPAPSASAEPPMTVAERAASGDYKSIDELKAKPVTERTAEETLALARGRSGNKARALDGFGKEIKKTPALLEDKAQLQRLKDFLNDRETTNQAVALLMELGAPIGPDLLYDAATRPKGNPDTAQLAEDLLVSKELRAMASPALLVALDMRKAEQCEDFKNLLPAAAEKGDRRAVPMLIKLTNKRGCGDNKLGDCYECLRPLDKDKTAVNIAAAMKGAAKRAAPKL
jgi:hypothetical protein